MSLFERRIDGGLAEFEASAGLESRCVVAFRFRDVGGGGKASGVEVVAATDAVSAASLAEERVTLEDMRNLFWISRWYNSCDEDKGVICAGFEVGFKCKSDVAAAGGAQKRHPQKTAGCKTGCTYLEVEVGVEVEESCEDSIDKEGAGAIRLNLHRQR